MNKGVLIFAHNSQELDYSLMALIAGGLAKKHLNVPVSLVTDQDTIKWMKKSKIHSKAVKIFDQIIETPEIKTENARRLKDGNDYKIVPFKNASRPLVYELTPYDKTLLIDSDFLIFSDNLNNYWDVDSDVMLTNSIFDMANVDRSGYHDRYVSDIGPHLYWATAVMFSKTKYSENFFKLVDDIRKNFEVYAEIYRYDARLYRNDISFSIAKHILDGFTTDLSFSLPPVPITYDNDILEDVKLDSRLIFSMAQNANTFTAMSTKGRDIHIMNKQSIIRNKDKLLELI